MLSAEHDASDDVAGVAARAARARVEAGSNVRVVCAGRYVAAARFRALAADDPLLGAPDVVSRQRAGPRFWAMRGSATLDATRACWTNELAVLHGGDVKVSGLRPGRLRAMLRPSTRASATAPTMTSALADHRRRADRARHPHREPGGAAAAAVRGFVAGVSRPWKAEVEREPLTLVADDFGSLS